MGLFAIFQHFLLHFFIRAPQRFGIKQKKLKLKLKRGREEKTFNFLVCEMLERFFHKPEKLVERKCTQINFCAY